MDSLDWVSLNVNLWRNLHHVLTLGPLGPAAPTGPTEPAGPCKLEKQNQTGQPSPIPPTTLLPRLKPHSSRVWGGQSEASKEESTKGLVFTNLQVHHGFHVCQWDPQGHEDQVRPQRQRDQCCQGNRALPTRGKVKFSIQLAWILVTFKLEKDKEVCWPCVQVDRRGLGDHRSQGCPVKIPHQLRCSERLFTSPAPRVQLPCLHPSQPVRPTVGTAS